MTPSARLQAAIDIVCELQTSAAPADRFLRDWARAHRFAGSKDRAAIAERVYDVLRHRFSYAWRMRGDDPRRLVIASLATDHTEVGALFDGSPYGPAPLSSDEAAALAAPPSDPPLHARGEFPAFLESELTRAFGPALLDEMVALAARASVDLRVNSLKATRDAVLAALEANGFDATPTPYAPQGLRLPPGEGLAKLSATALYKDGAFEFQDEASQIAALLCVASPGWRVLDYAAGAGGKTLALAAQMQNRGKLIAHDSSPDRLRQLGPRAARAGATIIQSCTSLSSPSNGGREAADAGAFDLVLVDSPCSGTGTWRRQPELRGRLTRERLADLNRLQTRLLGDAAPFVAPGGRLVYVTCSVLPCENLDRIDDFLGKHPDFVLLPARESWPAAMRADRKSTRLNSSHYSRSRMPSSA